MVSLRKIRYIGSIVFQIEILHSNISADCGQMPAHMRDQMTNPAKLLKKKDQHLARTQIKNYKLKNRKLIIKV